MSTFVSIIIPTYNEAADIRDTLDSLAKIDYDDYEVLVVDASRDATPEIVASYPSSKVRLIRQTRGRGRAPARNEGVLAARGEIVVILNADVRVAPDFIRRILPHYEAGADYLLVESRVTNVEFAMPRYIQALHQYHYPATPEVEARMNWTEGFSCRREAVIAIGLMPEGGSILVSGEDGWFGENLEAAGYKKAFDHSIVVTHVMPANLKGFWAQRVERGHGVPQMWRDRNGWSANRIVANVLWLSFLSGLALVIPLPAMWRAWHISAFSPRGRADWPVFTVLGWIETVANLAGLFKGTRELRQTKTAAHEK
jgi:glycosyltransferase involved in cell wall biosynthesis